jgi:uncharacterized repeat protein (TIGR02543 family)
LGWATSKTATSATYQAGGTYSTDASTTLYAVWKLIQYTVTYDANGGTGAPAAQTKNKGTALTLSNTTPTRENYEFLGWATDKTATAATYQAGASFTTDGNTTLYAVWQEAITVTSGVITVGKGAASAGTTVSVPVKIQENPGIAGAAFKITYDSTALTLDGAEAGEVFSKGNFNANVENGVIQWYDIEADEDLTNNGTLFTLNFTVKDDAKDGTYPITISLKDGEAGNLTNKDSKSIAVTFENGAVQVTDQVRGDVTGDGKVTMGDVVKLSRAVSGYTTLTEQEQSQGDVTGDGKVTMGDVVKVARYVAGYITSLVAAQ